jgi:hypothetical protein
MIASKFLLKLVMLPATRHHSSPHNGSDKQQASCKKELSGGPSYWLSKLAGFSSRHGLLNLHQ